MICMRENTNNRGYMWLRFFHPLQTYLETRELNTLGHDRSPGYVLPITGISASPKQSKEIPPKVASEVTASHS